MKFDISLMKPTLSSCILLALVTKCLILGTGIGDAVAVCALSGLYAYTKFLNRKDELWQSIMQKQITELKNEVTSLKTASTLYLRKTNERKSEEKRYF